MDCPTNRRQLCGGSKPGIERMLEFGRELHNMSLRLRQDDSKDDSNKKMLQDAFSLLAYSNPWNSPVGWQLEPVQRETVCSTLNSAILGMLIKFRLSVHNSLFFSETSNLPRRPPLEVGLAHACELIHLMSRSGLGSCAFASVDEIFRQ